MINVLEEKLQVTKGFLCNVIRSNNDPGNGSDNICTPKDGSAF